MRVAAVIVTYNRKELLTGCIQHILNQKGETPDILVIDNHSIDGTKERIQAYIDAGQVDYTDMGANLGGAGGFSFGIRRAAEQGYDRIWVLIALAELKWCADQCSLERRKPLHHEPAAQNPDPKHKRF